MNIKLNILPILFLVFSSVLLSACGSGSGSGGNDQLNSGSDNQHAADGIWRGSVLINSVLYNDIFVVIKDGYFIGYSESAGELFKGNLTIGDTSIDGELAQYELAGTFIGNVNFTGTFENQVSVNLSSNTDIVFTLSYNNLHQRSVTLSDLVGTWIHTDTGLLYTLTTTFQSNGTFEASDSNGCLINGSVSHPDSNNNTFVISYTASSCGSGNGLYQGFVVLDDDTGTNDLIRIVAAGSNHAFAGLALIELPVIQRSTDELRVINSGDFFEYRIAGQYSNLAGIPTSVTGTLRIEWFDDVLAAPLGTAGIIPVLREETTLQLDGGISTATTIRYVQQDLITGDLQLLAIRDGVQNLWVTTENAALNDLQPIDYFVSPVPSTSGMVRDANYDVFNGCDTPSPSCSAWIATVSDTRTYVGDSAITIDSGRFNALRIDYQGIFNSTIITLLDFRGSCDANSASFFGSIYSFPEVGVLFWENSCAALGGGGYHITASLTDTNIPLP